MLLFADDVVLIFDKEERLQRAVFELHKISKGYIKILSRKIYLIAFHRKFPTIMKIIIEDVWVEQISHFRYLDCDVTNEKDQIINQKVPEFQVICDTIQRMLKGKITQDSQLRFYSIMALLVLKYGSETWTINKQRHKLTTVSSKVFLRAVKGCTRWDYWTVYALQHLIIAHTFSDITIYIANYPFPFALGMSSTCKFWNIKLNNMQVDSLNEYLWEFNTCIKYTNITTHTFIFNPFASVLVSYTDHFCTSKYGYLS